MLTFLRSWLLVLILPQISITVSDIMLHLTEIQYGLLIKLAQAIPEVLAPPLGPLDHSGALTGNAPPVIEKEGDVHLAPISRIPPSGTSTPTWPTLDLVVFVGAIELHLYDGGATSEPNLKDHGIARFALNNNALRSKLLSDGSGETEVILRSFTMTNTRPRTSKFREIIPAAQHERNQFMLLYTVSADHTACAILTVDAPQIILAIDPVMAVLEFFTGAFSSQQSIGPREETLFEHEENEYAQSAMNFRIELHDLSVTVLENDEDPNSQCMKLSIQHIIVSQQVLRISSDFLVLLIGRSGSLSFVIKASRNVVDSNGESFGKRAIFG